MKKYILVGSKIISKIDGSEQYISSSQLAKLYNLDSNDCLFVDGDCFYWSELKKIAPDALMLHPDPTGEYKL
jgi:hypothetical protein